MYNLQSNSGSSGLPQKPSTLVPYVSNDLIQMPQTIIQSGNFRHKDLFNRFIQTPIGNIITASIAQRLYCVTQFYDFVYRAIDEVVLRPQEGEILPTEKSCKRVDIAIAFEPLITKEYRVMKRREKNSKQQYVTMPQNSKEKRQWPTGTAVIELKTSYDDLIHGTRPDQYVGLSKLLYLGVPENLIEPAVMRLCQIPYGRIMGLINMDTGDVVIQPTIQGVTGEHLVTSMMMSDRMFNDTLHSFGPFTTRLMYCLNESYSQLTNGNYVNGRYYDIVCNAIRLYYQNYPYMPW